MMTNDRNPVASTNRPLVSATSARPVDAKQGNAFARELNRQERKQDNQDKTKGDVLGQEDDADPKSAAKASGFARKSGLEKEGEQGDDNGFTLDAALASKIRDSKMSFAAKASQAEVPPAHLEKIAAAIAELTAKGADAQYQLNLPMGPAHIEGAILGRDAGGRIMIQLLSPSVLPPQLASQLAADLTRRLQDKKLKLGEIAFSKNYAAADSSRVAGKAGT
jgi:hypothetical protein